VHAKVLPWTICLPILVLIAQTVFILERGQTDKQTDLTKRPTPRRRGWRIYSRDRTAEPQSISLRLRSDLVPESGEYKLVRVVLQSRRPKANPFFIGLLLAGKGLAAGAAVSHLPSLFSFNSSVFLRNSAKV